MGLNVSHLRHRLSRSAWLLAAAWSCCLMAVAYLLFHARYDVNDDVRMMMIAAGRGFTNSPDPHVLFNHFGLGQILALLYRWAPQVPWYGLHLYLACGIGSVVLSAIVLKNNNTHSRMSAAAWLLAGLLPLFWRIQYSGVAMLLGASALALMLKGKSLWRIPISAGLFLWAAAIRWEASMLAGLLFVPYIWLHIKQEIKDRQIGVPGSKQVTMLFFILSIATIPVISHLSNRAIYHSDPDWRSFYPKNSLRAALTDYQVTGYAQDSALFQSLGWDKTAFDMYQSWFVADTLLHQTGDLQRISAGRSLLRRAPHNLMRSAGQNLRTLPVIAVLILVLLSLNWPSTYNPVICLTIAGGIMLLGGLAITGWLHPRISQPVVALMLWVVWALSDRDAPAWQHPAARRWAIASGIRTVLVILLIALFFSMLYLGHRDRQRSRAATAAAAALRQQTQAHNWVIWADSFPFEQLARPLACTPGIQERWIESGLSAYTPFFTLSLQQAGAKDIHHLIRLPETVLIARKEFIELYAAYMLRHYGVNIRAEAINTASYEALPAWYVVWDN